MIVFAFQYSLWFEDRGSLLNVLQCVDVTASELSMTGGFSENVLRKLKKAGLVLLPQT